MSPFAFWTCWVRLASLPVLRLGGIFGGGACYRPGPVHPPLVGQVTLSVQQQGTPLTVTHWPQILPILPTPCECSQDLPRASSWNPPGVEIFLSLLQEAQLLLCPIAGTSTSFPEICIQLRDVLPFTQPVRCSSTASKLGDQSMS